MFIMIETLLELNKLTKFKYIIQTDGARFHLIDCEGTTIRTSVYYEDMIDTMVGIIRESQYKERGNCPALFSLLY